MSKAKRNARRFIALSAAAAAAMSGVVNPLFMSRAEAAIDTWVGNTDTTFGTGANWSPAVTPVSGDSFIFGAAGSKGATLTDNLIAGNIAGITFNVGASAYTITNINVQTLTGSIINNSASLETLNGPFALLTTQSISGSGSVTLGGVISGAGGLTYSGTGTLSLTDPAANTFAGGLNINSGIVGFTASNQLGTGTITLAGGTLAQTGTGSQPVLTQNIVVTGTSSINVAQAAANTYAGKIFLSTAGQLTGSNTATIVRGGATTAGFGDLQITATQAGYAGNWVLNSGTTEVQAQLGLGTGSVTINTGTDLDISNVAGFTTNSITLNGGQLSAENGTALLGGNINVAAASNIGLRDNFNLANGRSIAFGGTLSGSGALTLNGSTTAGQFGMFAVGNAGTYTGTTITVNAQAALGVASGGIGLAPASTTIVLNSGAQLGLVADGDGTSSQQTIAYTQGANPISFGAGNLGYVVGRIGASVLSNTEANKTIALSTNLLNNATNSLQVTTLNGYGLLLSGQSPLAATQTYNVGGVQASNVVPGLTLTNLTGASDIIKTGTGTLQLGLNAADASNTFGTGVATSITVNGGLVSAFADQNLGNTNNGVNLAGGGFLALAGYASSSRLFTIGTGGGTFAVAGQNNNFTITTGLAYAAAANAITKTENGTLTLTTIATGTPTSATTISGGALAITNSNQIGSGTITVSNSVGEALRISGGGTFTQALSLNSYGIQGRGALENVSGANTWSTGVITMAAAGAIGNDDAVNALTIGSSITATGAVGFVGPGNITVSTAMTGTGTVTGYGSGILTFTATGTTYGTLSADNGTIVLAGTSTAGAGATNANFGGTITVDDTGTNPVTPRLATHTFATVGSGSFNLNGNASANSAEGFLGFSPGRGQTTITVNPNGGNQANLTLTATGGTWTHNQFSTAVFTAGGAPLATSLTAGAGTINTGSITAAANFLGAGTSQTGTANIGILPWALVNNNGTITLATSTVIGPSGFLRNLAAGETASDFVNNFNFAPGSTLVGSTTTGSSTINTSNTSGLFVGEAVTGANIPANSFITSITANTSITLNNNATATNATVPLSFSTTGVNLNLTGASLGLGGTVGQPGTLAQTINSLTLGVGGSLVQPNSNTVLTIGNNALGGAILALDPAGQTIAGGQITGGGQELIIHTPTGTNLTISSNIIGGGGGAGGGVTKADGGTLTLTGTSFHNGQTVVNAGTLSLNAGNNTIQYANFTNLGAGAALQLNSNNQIVTDLFSDSTAFAAGLGVVGPNSSVTGTGGVLTLKRDNAVRNYTGQIGGSLGLVVSGQNTWTLTQAQTYSGPTLINTAGGTVDLQNNATLATSALTINRSTLALDNTGSIDVPVRLPTGLAISLGGGTISYLGQAQFTSAETLGAVTTTEGANTINVTNNNTGISSAQLTLTSLTRTAGSTVNFTNTNGTLGTIGSNPQIFYTSAPTLTNSLIGGGYTVNGTDFASYNSFGVGALGTTGFAGYSSLLLNNAASTDNVSMPGSTGVNVNSQTINSLRATGTVAVNFNSGQTLTLASGGLLSTAALTLGGATNQGNLTSGGSELFLLGTGNSTINSIITGAGVAVVKSGINTFTLNGTNTYAGGTVVDQGTLTLGNGGNVTLGQSTLGTGGIFLNGGNLTQNAGSIIPAQAATISGSSTLSMSSDLGVANSVTTFGSNTITVPSTNGIHVGDLVTGTGIPTNEVVTGVNTVTNTVTVTTGSGVSAGTNTLTFRNLNNSLSSVTFNNDGGSSPTLTNTGLLNITTGTITASSNNVGGGSTASVNTLTGGIVDLKNVASPTITVNPIAFNGQNLAPYQPTLIINSVLQDANNAVQVTGGGNLQLGGANTFTGGVNLANNTALTIAAGSTNQVSGQPLTGPLGLGTLTLNTGNTLYSTGTFTVGNNVVLNSNALTFDAPSNATASLTLGAGSQTIALQPGNTTITVNAPNMTGGFGGSVTGAGSIITKAGLGTLLLNNGLGGNSTFSGGIVINAGTVLATGNGSVGTSLGTGPVRLNGGLLSLHNNAGITFGNEVDISTALANAYIDINTNGGATGNNTIVMGKLDYGTITGTSFTSTVAGNAAPGTILNITGGNNYRLQFTSTSLTGATSSPTFDVGAGLTLILPGGFTLGSNLPVNIGPGTLAFGGNNTGQTITSPLVGSVTMAVAANNSTTPFGTGPLTLSAGSTLSLTPGMPNASNTNTTLSNAGYTSGGVLTKYFATGQTTLYTPTAYGPGPGSTLVGTPLNDGHLAMGPVGVNGGGPLSTTMVTYQALLNVTNAGTYYFGVGTDDNMQLVIDGQTVQIVNGAGQALNQVGLAPLTLSAGAHQITVREHNNGGGGGSYVFYSGPDTGADGLSGTPPVSNLQAIPLSALSYATNYTAGNNFQNAAILGNAITVATGSATIDGVGTDFNYGIPSLTLQNGATLVVANGTGTVASAGNGAFIVTGTTDVTAGAATLNTTTGTLVLAGGISDSASGLTKTGQGNLVLGPSAGTFTGPLAINNGFVQLADPAGLTTGATTVGFFQSVSSGTGTTSGSNVVTVPTTTGLLVGEFVAGAGIPNNSTITSITDATHVVLSANATATGTPTLQFQIGATLDLNGQTVTTTGNIILDGGAGPAAKSSATPAALYNSSSTAASLPVGGFVSVGAPIGTTNASIGGFGNINIRGTLQDLAGTPGQPLNKVGPDTLTLSGSNIFTGQFNVSSGTLQAANANALGANASLPGSGTTSGSTTVTVTSSAGLTVGSAVTGTGVPAGATIASITDTTHIVLSTAATATGTVTLSAAAPMIVSSGATFDLNGQSLASGRPLSLNGAGLTGNAGPNQLGSLIDSSASNASYAGNITLAGTTAIGGPSLIAGNGSITLSGTIVGNNQITKVGANALALTSAANANAISLIDVQNGSVTVSGASAIGQTNSDFVRQGTTLTLDNTGTAVNNRMGLNTLAGDQGLWLSGNFVIKGNATTAVQELVNTGGNNVAVGTTFANGYGGGSVTLNSTGTAGVTLSIGSTSTSIFARAAGGTLLLRGDNLGTIASGTSGASNIIGNTTSLGLSGNNGQSTGQAGVWNAPNALIYPWALADISSSGSGTGFAGYNGYTSATAISGTAANVQGNVFGVSSLANDANNAFTAAPALSALNVNTTNASTQVTTTNTAGLAVGQLVNGAGLPANAVITSIVNGTTFTISANATATGNTSAVVYANSTPSLTPSGTGVSFLNTTVTVTSTAGLYAGAVVSGAGLASGTTVSSITDATHFVVSITPTGNNTSTPLTIGLPGYANIVSAAATNSFGMPTAAQEINSLTLNKPTTGSTTTLTTGLQLDSGGILALGTATATPYVINSGGSYQYLTGTNTLNREMIVHTVGAGTTLTVNAPIFGNGGGLTKADTGTLVLGAGELYTGDTVVNGGTLKLAAGQNTISKPFTTSATPGNAAAAPNIQNLTIDFGGTLDLNGTTQAVSNLRSGSGTDLMGGTILNSNASTPATLAIALFSSPAVNETWSGNLSGGAGTLNFVRDGQLTLFINSPQTMTGAVTIMGGATTLTDLGTFQNASAINVTESALIWNDQGNSAISNRLSSTAPITLTGGGLQFLTRDAAGANPSAAISLGTLNLGIGEASVIISNVGQGANASVTFAGIGTRATGSTLVVGNAVYQTGGNPEYFFTSAPALTNGIIGPWFVVNSLVSSTGATNAGFATYDPVAGVRALQYQPNFTYGAGVNTMINGSTTIPAPVGVATTTHVNTLSIYGGSTLSFTNPTDTLVADSGGILAGTDANGKVIGSTAVPGIIQSGTGNDLYIHIGNNTMTINSVIADNGSNNNLIIDGMSLANTATIALNNANTYGGTTYLSGATLALNSAAGPAVPGNIILSGGNNAAGDSLVDSQTQLSFNQANQLASTANVTMNGATRFNLGNSSNGVASNTQTINNLTITNGGGTNSGDGPTIFTGAGALTISGTLNSTGNSEVGTIPTINGFIALTAGNINVDANQFNPGQVGLAINANIAASSITKTGAGFLGIGGQSLNLVGTAFNLNGGGLAFSPSTGAVNSVLGSALVMAPATVFDTRGLTGVIGSIASASGTAQLTNGVLGTGGTLTTGLDNTSTSFAGAINSPSPTGQISITKIGTGTWTLTADSSATVSGTLTASGGTISLAPTGKVNFQTTTINSGATILLDNGTTAVNNRLGGANFVNSGTLAPTARTLNMQGGNLAINGNSGTAITENLGIVGVTGGGIITLNAAGTAGVNATLLGLGGQTTQTSLLIRGDNLGNAIGSGVASLSFATAGAIGSAPGIAFPGPQLSGLNNTAFKSVRPDILVDSTATGNGQGFLTIDSTTGLIRPLGFGPGIVNSMELAPLSSATSGGANVGLSSIVNGTSTGLAIPGVAAANVQANTLTLQSGGGVNLNLVPNNLWGANGAPLTVTANAGGVLNLAGSNTITAGVLASAGITTDLIVNGGSTLNLNASMTTTTNFVKAGGGTLILSQFQVTNGGNQTNAINGGTLQFAANLGTNPLWVFTNSGTVQSNNLALNAGTLDLNGNSQLVNGVTSQNPQPFGGGTAASPNIIITNTSATTATFSTQGASTVFGGEFQGNLNLDKSGNTAMSLSSPQTYTGTTTVRGGSLTLRDQATIASAANINLNFGELILDNTGLANVNQRILAAPVNLNGGTLRVNPSSLQTSQNLGTINVTGGTNLFYAAQYSNNGNSSAPTFTIAGINTSNNATLLIEAPYNGSLGGFNNANAHVFISNLNGSPFSASSLVNGIIGPQFVVANTNNLFDWATYSNASGVTTPGANGTPGYGALGGGATTNANVTATTLGTVGQTLNTLRIGNPAAATTLGMNGAADQLVLAAGGLLVSSNNQAITFQGGSITAGTLNNPSTLYLHAGSQNTITFNSPISNNGTGALSLVRDGSTTVTFTPQIVEQVSVPPSVTTLTVPSATGLFVGMNVTGTNVTAGTAITTIAGTTVTLSGATGTTATANQQLTFAAPVAAGLVVTAASNSVTIPATIALATSGTTNASTTVTVSSTAGLVIGEYITGTGIPLGATVSSIGTGSVVISAAATATGSITATFSALPGGQTLTAANVGQAFGNAAIPGGTTITAVSGTTVTLSQPALASATSATVGASSNTYTGTTTINGSVDQYTGGTTNLTGVAGSIAIKGDLAISNATVTMNTNQGQIAATSNVTVNGGGVLNLTGTNTLNTLTFNNSGGIATPTVAVGTLLNLSSSTPITVVNDNPGFLPTISGTTLNLANTGGSTITTSGLSSTDLSITAAITSAGIITKAGTGSLILPNANAAILSWNLAAGNLILNNATALGAAGSALGITGANVQIQSGTGVQTVATPIIFGATSNVTLGNSHPNNSIILSGAVNLNGNAVTFTDNYIPNTNTISGIISGTTPGITKAGVGALTLSGANTFTGPITVSGGLLTLGSSNALNMSSATGTNTGADVTVATPAELNLNGNTQSIGSLSGGGIVTNSGAGAALTIGAGGNANSTTFGGAIAEATPGSLSVIKVGTTSLTLNGQSYYAGSTTVNGGSLKLANNNGSATAVTLANSAITVNSGATLAVNATGAGTNNTVNIGAAQATGSSASISLSSGGTLDLRDNTIGTLNVAGTASFVGSQLTASSGSSLFFDLGTTSADVINLTSQASVTGGTINVNVLGSATSLPVGNVPLINAAGGGFVGSGSNNFTLGTPTSVTLGGKTYTLGLTGTTTQTALSISLPPLTAAFWSGVQSANWNTNGTGGVTNWRTTATSGIDTQVLPGSTTTVTFDTTAPAATNLTNTLAQPFSIAGLQFAATATAPVVISDGGNNANTLTIGAGGITLNNTSGTQTINANILLGAAQTWTNAGGGTLVVNGDASFPAVSVGSNVLTVAGTGGITIAAPIQGSGSLTKNGTGNLTVSGIATYSGATNVNGGTLTLPQGLVTSGGTITIADGAVVQAAGSIVRNFAFTPTNPPNAGNTGQVAATGFLVLSNSSGPVNVGGVLNTQANNVQIASPVNSNVNGLLMAGGGYLTSGSGIQTPNDVNQAEITGESGLIQINAPVSSNPAVIGGVFKMGSAPGDIGAVIQGVNANDYLKFTGIVRGGITGDGVNLDFSQAVLQLGFSPGLTPNSGNITLTSSANFLLYGNLPWTPKTPTSSLLSSSNTYFGANTGQLGMYTQTETYGKNTNGTLPASAGTITVAGTTVFNYAPDSGGLVTSFFPTQKFYILRTDVHMVPGFVSGGNTTSYYDGLISGSGTLPAISTLFPTLPTLPSGLKWAYEANSQFLKLYVTSNNLGQGSGTWTNAAGDNNWTSNNATANWATAQPSSMGEVATFGALGSTAYAGGVVNLDKTGQTIGSLVLSDSGQGGYTIGRNGGTVAIASTTGGSNTVTLTAPAPANLVVGTSFLGSYVTAVSGTSVTLADNVPTASTYPISASGTVVPYGSALTFDNGTAVVASPYSATPTAATVAVNSGSHTIASPVVVVSGLSVNTAASSSVTFSGGVSSGFQVGNTVTKSGAGTMILGGANTYTGSTTVNAGSLFVNGTLTPAAGNFTAASVAVNNTATLGGTGTISPAVTIASGGAITAGTGTQAGNPTGVLTTTSQTWNSNGTYLWKASPSITPNPSVGSVTVSGTPVGTTDPTLISSQSSSSTSWDMLTINSLTVSSTAGSPFVISLVATAPLNPGTYTIADITSGNVNGTNFSSNPSGLQSTLLGLLSLSVPPVAQGGSTYSLGAISDGLGGDDIVVNYSPAPEPTSLMLLGLGAGGLLLRRRRRQTV